ncbi:MAG: hypothetical protein ACUVXJ_19885 [Phycisphaerae bacterium]
MYGGLVLDSDLVELFDCGHLASGLGDLDAVAQQDEPALGQIGPMRPGSLTRQYKDRKHKTGAYWQINHTCRMKSRKEYVREEWLEDIQRQIAAHKRFKRLIDLWTDLCIEHSEPSMQIDRPRA